MFDSLLILKVREGAVFVGFTGRHSFQCHLTALPVVLSTGR
jgi:hypothetical protein